MRGAMPAAAMPMTRASGVSAPRKAAASDATSIAAAPSFRPYAFPAVTVPSARTSGFNRPGASRLVARCIR
jgi:hypothetical protein